MHIRYSLLFLHPFIGPIYGSCVVYRSFISQGSLVCESWVFYMVSFSSHTVSIFILSFSLLPRNPGAVASEHVLVQQVSEGLHSGAQSPHTVRRNALRSSAV